MQNYAQIENIDFYSLNNIKIKLKLRMRKISPNIVKR